MTTVVFAKEGQGIKTKSQGDGRACKRGPIEFLQGNWCFSGKSRKNRKQEKHLLVFVEYLHTWTV